MNKNKKAFTLVELIVVITIIAILGTIAFISLQGYSSDARDSARISDLSNIDLQLELYLIKGTKLPIPNDAITLVSNGITVGYQGYIGEESLNTIGVHGGGKDPLDDSLYTYRINGNKTTYQVMGFLEDGTEVSGLFPSTYAADLTKRQPTTKGKTLGILLEQTTNKPFQELETGTVDLRINTTNVYMYLSNNSKKSGTVQELYGTMETLSLSQNFIAPKECPTGFIPVPGNRDIGQTAFCVAKYEMSYSGLKQTDISGDFNTYSYLDNVGTRPALGNIVSEQGNSPIAEITQPEAIAECLSMGDGYHLITNNEWMTISKNIEQQGGNWSSGIVGNGYIFSGESNDPITGCPGNPTTNSPTPSIRATITGDENCENQKNKLIMSNGEEIWDLSGNLREHVNKTNTVDGTNYDIVTNPDILTTNSAWGEWSSASAYYKELYGPSIGVNSTNGIGRVFQGDGTIFIRGSATYGSSDAGIFALFMNWVSNRQDRAVGFRCSK